MGLVLWIDQNTFATSLLEKVFKKKNLPFYSLARADDFVYLVEDLRPEMIVLDGETALHQLEAFKSQYDSSEALKSLPFIIVDDKGGLEFLQKVAGQIKKPFDPFAIPELISKIALT